MLKFLLVGLVFAVSGFSGMTQAKSIVVLGDSISANYKFAEKYGWVTLLGDHLKNSHPDYTVYNASISGDTTAGGIARLPQLLRRYQPDLVLIELGANDGLRGMSLKAMQKNLSTLVELAQKSGAQVLLLSMRIPRNYGKRYIDMFYNSYQQVGDQHKVPVVPFILEGVALDKSKMQADGLHPNKKAQPIIFQHVLPYIVPLLG
ncbi:MAG: arylesterase [Methyloprofundus sp.]|nr:arylesterase [Methyloprofundus sp.]